MSFKQFLSLRSRTNILYAFLVYPTCHLSCPSHPSLFDHPDTIRCRVQTAKLPVMYFLYSPVSCEVKIFPPVLFFEAPQSVFLPDHPSSDTSQSVSAVFKIYVSLYSALTWPHAVEIQHTLITFHFSYNYFILITANLKYWKEYSCYTGLRHMATEQLQAEISGFHSSEYEV